MRLITITILAVAGRLVQALAIAKPVSNLKEGGMAIPLAMRSSFLDSNESIDLGAMTSHGISVREKILSGLDNYEINTGRVHPFALKRNESGLRTRGAGAPLTTDIRKESWMAEVSIGTPPKTRRVHIDTGAADMWVLQTGCIGISGDRDLWDPKLSASAWYQVRSFRLKYGDGTLVTGNQYSDIVTIAGFTAYQKFGSVVSYTSPSENNGNADGLLGLAYPSVSGFTGNAYPLIVSLVQQGKLINPTFSMKLSSPGAELYVGGANSMLYKGDIAYTSVINPGLWLVSMDDVRVHGVKIFENVPAVIDSGSTYIFGDSERVSELYRRIGGTLKPQEGKEAFDFYYLPCNSFPTLSFTFGGTSFEIPPGVLRLKPIKKGSPNCVSAIIGERLPVAHWIIGMAFMQGVYTVFDYSTEQVGFASLA